MAAKHEAMFWWPVKHDITTEEAKQQALADLPKLAHDQGLGWHRFMPVTWSFPTEPVRCPVSGTLHAAVVAYTEVYKYDDLQKEAEETAIT